MRCRILLFLGASVVLFGCAHRPAIAQPRFWDGHLNIEGGRGAEKCSDLRVRANGELVQATENFTLSKTQAPSLGVRGEGHTSLHVRGWDRPDYAVEVCRYAAAGSRSEANRLLQSIAITRSGAHVTATGPGTDSRWAAVLFIHAPKDAAMDVESGNGPMDVSAVTGKLNLRATNGPLSLANCSGTIEGETTNGPISMNGGSGDVHLRAVNGPISLKLAGQAWNGQLEASTMNGPVSLIVPAGLRSGLRLETSGHGPISCRADVCQNARTEGSRFFPRLLQTGSGDVIHLSTHNGPVSLSNGDRRERII